MRRTTCNHGIAMKRLLDVLMVTTMLGVFVGGLFFVISWQSPEPHVPYKGVTLPNGVHIVTSRSWFRLSYFTSETYDAFQRQPVALKWLKAGANSINLEPAAPALGSEPMLILIHGYNAPESKVGSYFAGALDLLRSAVGPGTTIIIYDWPSTARHWEELTHQERRAQIDPGGGPRPMPNSMAPINWESRAYRDDMHAARGHGADGLAALLALLSWNVPKSITIIAHSMGALVTLEALRRPAGATLSIDNIVLLAPDLPADALVDPQNAPVLRRVRRMHVMHSRNDDALWYSQIANKNPRLGRDGHRGNHPPPPHVTMHDVTDRLGDGIAVHGRYLERDGASVIGLADVVGQRSR